MEIPGLELIASAERAPWRSTSSPGVQWLLLASEPEAEGPASERGATVLIRMEPGRGYPAHLHLGVEDVLVLAGGYRDSDGDHVAGSYVRYAAGTSHAPVALGDPERPAGPNNPACLLFAVARGGIRQIDGPARS